MYAGRFEEALADLNRLAGEAEDPAQILYMRAVCLRYLGDHDAALEALSALKDLMPEYGRAYQEQGHVARALGRMDEALTAYRHACRYNPALEASWRAQADILSQLGCGEEASRAAGQADSLAQLPEELLAVSNFLHEGKLLKAEQLCRQYMQRHPTTVEGMRLLAQIGMRFNVLEDAEFLLESAVAFEPEYIEARLDYVEVLRKRQKFEAALAQAQILYDSDPASPVFQSVLAIEHLQLGHYDEALVLFDQVLAQLPGDPVTLTSKGHALKTYGRQNEAVSAYQAAIEKDPGHGDAYYGLANLKTYHFRATELENMRRQAEAPGLTHQNKVYFNFALGKAEEDNKNYATAFAAYDRGNALKRAQSRYDAAQMTAEFDAQMKHCTSALFSQNVGNGYPARDPIFILGLPRAGSTLLEQILASHSQVDGTLELPNILALSQRLRGRKMLSQASCYPANLSALPADTLKTLGEAYIEETRIHRQGAPFFIDKMPNNFRHVGLIHLILPNAKIIDARREPMACCFSGFKQLFAEGQEFTYGLEEIGQYYRDYVRLMRHWDTVLPGKILRVQHEDVIEDLEGQIRRMLTFCGLEFEQACVDYHKTERTVRTASSEQVRQPIFRSGIDQWRHFESWLDPLKSALGPALKEYRA